MQETVHDRAARYGVTETNPMEPGYHETVDYSTTVYWTDPELKEITRLRLLTDYGFPLYDISYCHGRLKDGRVVTVRLPFGQLSKREWKTEILRYARQDNVYAKGLRIWEDDVVSKLSA
jgi:hypothetical protein